MGRRTGDTEQRKDAMAAAERFRKLLDEWMADDSGYDKEAWPELKEGLDRNRPEYRKHFPEQAQDPPKAVEG
jgi:hypothetical protein